MIFPISRSPAISPVRVQFALVLAGLALLALAPPAAGRMIAIPLSASASANVLVTALDQGALPLGGGPFPGSHIIIGARADLAGPLLRRGVILVAAPYAGCGTGQGGLA